MFKVEKSKIQIKAHDNQVIRTDEPLPKTSCIWCICGRKGSGKSSLLLTALQTKQNQGGYKKYFNNIFMVSPTGKHDKKLSKLVNELEEDGKFYDNLNEETMQEIMNRINEFNEEHDGETINNLLILDDCMSSLPTSTQKSSILNNMFILSRHKKLSIFVTTQKYNGLSRVIRTQCDLISFFRTDNKKELQTLIDDVNVDDDTLKQLYNFATSESKNDFLHINMLSNPVSYYKKFDKIII